MTELLGTCNASDLARKNTHVQTAACVDWKPVTQRVEIWRYNDNTLTVARSDGATWNGPDTMFTGARHMGVWSSKDMAFLHPSHLWPGHTHFTDGTPVALYDLVAMVIERDGETFLA